MAILSLEEKLNQIKLNMGEEEELSLEDKLSKIKLNLQTTSTTPVEAPKLSLEEKLGKIKSNITPIQDVTTPAPVTTPIKTPIGTGAQAKGGITLPGTKPLMEGLPISKPEDKPGIKGLDIVGGAITQLPKQLIAASLQLQGAKGASVVNKDWADKFIESAQKDQAELAKKAIDKYGDLSFMGLKLSDVAQMPQSMAYSGVSMGSGLATGVPIGLIPLPGSRVLAWAAGTAASGKAAYEMSTYQIMQTYLEAKNEEKMATSGEGLSLEEENSLKQGFNKLASQYGLWEAVPEALSNLAFAGILTAPLSKMVGKSIAGKIVEKLAGMYGEELLTETITQIGQKGVMGKAGLPGGGEVDWKSPTEWVEAFKEVAPQTFLLTTVMAGTGGAIINTNKIVKSLKSEVKDSEVKAELIKKVENKETLKEAVKEAEAPTQPLKTPAELKAELDEIYPQEKAVEKQEQPTPAIPPELEGLAEEARKYGSAEEFTKEVRQFNFPEDSNINILWHATTKDVVDKISKEGFKSGTGLNSSGMSTGNGVWFYPEYSDAWKFSEGNVPSFKDKKVDIVKGVAIGKILDTTDMKFEGYTGQRNIANLAGDKEFIAKAKADGYIGIKGNEQIVTKNAEGKRNIKNTPSVFIFEGENIKTKQDLTDFYHQATAGKAVEAVTEPSSLKDVVVQKYQLNEGIDKPIKTELMLGDLTLSKKSIEGALQDIEYGSPSKTNAPIKLHYDTENKSFIVTDGQHRIAKLIKQGKASATNKIPVQIISSGYSDYYSTPFGDNIYKLPAPVAEKATAVPTKEDFTALNTTDNNKELFFDKYNQVYTETKKAYEKLIDNTVADLKEEGFKGVDKGGLKKDQEGYITGTFPTTSRNPQWYRDFYEQNKKAPTNKDLREIAIQQLSQGHTEDYGEIPADNLFVTYEAQLDILNTILGDIKKGNYNLKDPKNITKLNNAITEAGNGKVSKIAGSIEAKSIEQGLTKGYGHLAEYTPIVIKDQAKKATDLINSNIDEARKIIRGDSPLPEGLKGTALITAMEEHIKKTADGELASELASSPLVSGTSAAAQELRLAAERDQESPVKAIADINKLLEERAKKRYPGKALNKTKASDISNIKAEIKKADSTQSWQKVQSFIESIRCT